MKVKLINITESPEKTIEIAAKLSEGKEITYDDKKPDRDFIREMIDYGADVVLEHAVATFKISGISRVCSHQLVRHRLASYLQKSQRYVDEKNFDFVIPETINECGDVIPFNTKKLVFRDTMRKCEEAYRSLIGMGVPKEDARFVLPNACTTKLIMTANFREWRHIIKQRTSEAAQWEIRQLMKLILVHLREIAPSVFGDL